MIGVGSVVVRTCNAICTEPLPAGWNGRYLVATISPAKSAYGESRTTPMIEHGRVATMNGTIKRLNSDKGFGFVASGEGNDYFFHQSACNGVEFDDLREGEAVTFEAGEGPKGPRAETVRLDGGGA